MSFVNVLLTRRFKNQVRSGGLKYGVMFAQKCEAKRGRSGDWVKGTIVINDVGGMFWHPEGSCRNVFINIKTLQPQNVKSTPWFYAETLTEPYTQIVLKLSNKYFMLKFAYNVRHFLRHIIFS